MPAKATVSFVAEVLIVGVNPYVVVTSADAAALRAEWRRPMAVVVQLNAGPATPWRTNLMPRGDGSFYLYLHAEMRKSSSVAVGDQVRVTLRLDDKYRNGPQHEVPEWFHGALEESPRAMANWQALTPSRQKEILRYFAGLKSDGAKERNLLRAMRVLNGASERFMGRDWMYGR